MAKFLTAEWAASLVGALNGSDEVKTALAGVDLTIQQVVTGAPGGETKYWTKLVDGSVHAALGETADPDVVITQDYDTAAAQDRGELNAQAAFMQGKLKITGNMGKLLQNQKAVAAMGPVVSAVPTEY
jgi:SCP-2 sterol transfer family protein